MHYFFSLLVTGYLFASGANLAHYLNDAPVDIGEGMVAEALAEASPSQSNDKPVTKQDEFNAELFDTITNKFHHLYSHYSTHFQTTLAKIVNAVSQQQARLQVGAESSTFALPISPDSAITESLHALTNHTLAKDAVLRARRAIAAADKLLLLSDRPTTPI